jgi:hypothetical protein
MTSAASLPTAISADSAIVVPNPNPSPKEKLSSQNSGPLRAKAWASASPKGNRAIFSP